MRKIFLKDFFYTKFFRLAPNICFWLRMLVLYELRLTSIEFSEMAVTNVAFLLWFISAGYFTSTQRTEQTERCHWFNFASKAVSGRFRPFQAVSAGRHIEQRGAARFFFKLQPRAAIARPLPVSVHDKNWLRIPFNWLSKHLVCVSNKADHCIVSVMLWSPQWEQI